MYIKRLSKFQMLKRNHPCVSAKAVTIEKNSMSRQKSLLCIDTIWSCKVAAKILLFIETKITERDWKARFTFQIQFLLLARPGKTQSQLFFPSWRTRPTLSYVQVVIKRLKNKRFIIKTIHFIPQSNSSACWQHSFTTCKPTWLHHHNINNNSLQE